MSTGSKTDSTVLIFGPTGVGKTRFLLEDLPPGFEVVAVDSIQVYRGLDIGSAKPTPSERSRIPHHLIDIRDPEQGFDVGDFISEARSAITEIRGRGHVPVLSGGTAFYFQNFLLGLPQTPPSQPEQRALAQSKWESEGELGFRRSLSAVDPLSAARIQVGDSYRLQRAWEVWLLSGKPLSSFGRNTPEDLGAVFLAGLDRPREELYRRIEARVDKMLEDGLEKEVRELLARGCGATTPALKGIGYAQWFPFLTTGQGSLATVRDQIVLMSRRYAKRQLTFFRALENVRWYDADNHSALVSDLKDWSLTNAPGWW